jgi:hypothetical protein
MKTRSSEKDSVMERLLQKKKRDEAMSLMEFAKISGWGYPTLRAMNLPLIGGKIPYSDFRRHVRKLQNNIRADAAKLTAASSEKDHLPPQAEARLNEIRRECGLR